MLPASLLGTGFAAAARVPNVDRITNAASVVAIYVGVCNVSCLSCCCFMMFLLHFLMFYSVLLFFAVLPSVASVPTITGNPDVVSISVAAGFLNFTCVLAVVASPCCCC
jgi:hypothetical protein